MAVAKMTYLNVYGPENRLTDALGAIARSELFAPEESDGFYATVSGTANPYDPLLTKAKGLLKDLGVTSLVNDYIGPDDAFETAQVAAFLENFAADVAQRNRRKVALQNELEVQKKAHTLLRHMADMDVNFDELLDLEYLQTRSGRLPKDSYVRLAYYVDKDFDFTSYFNFIIYDFDGEYYWGMYFVPADSAAEVDAIFDSLYFERLTLPETVRGKPDEALANINHRVAQLRKELDDVTSPGGIVNRQELQTIQQMASWLLYRSQIHEMQHYALVFNDNFYISGFVAEDDVPRFEDTVNHLDSVHVKMADESEKLPAKPPVKLKNRWFNRPFEMFTEMYGLPGYTEVDPTPIVAVLYAVLYGIMFADVGQGLVLGLIGYVFMYKMRGMEMGRVLARAAIFSVLFGFLFGSFFGFEEVFNPLFAKLGLNFLPFHIMGSSSIMVILITALGIGVAVVLYAIAMNIIIKLRARQWGEAITGPNGVAGFVFYGGVVLFAVDKLTGFAGGNIGGTLYVVLVFVLPLLVIYFEQPLTQLLNGQKPHIESLSDLFVNSFFELFVTLLEYLSSTVSFLRVGGFVLAHAGMMTVVMTLAGMSSGVARVVILVLGNLFVIALEGLIVGIQALRLNYYELFSRFYDPHGTPFVPLQLHSDTVEM